MQSLSNRLGKITNIEHHSAGVTVSAEIPTRGLIGFESDLVTLTSGNGVMSHMFLEYRPYKGELVTRQTGTLVSMENGNAMAYALDMLQTRGNLFISPGDSVYAGQVVGENPRRDDLPVNPAKAKHLDNMRASGSDKSIVIVFLFNITPYTPKNFEHMRIMFFEFCSYKRIKIINPKICLSTFCKILHLSRKRVMVHSTTSV